MGQSKEKPKPDESFLQEMDPELLAHSLVTILLKNTSLQPELLQDALKQWRERFMFGGEKITLIDVLVQNGNLERYKVPALVKASEYALKRREDKLFGKRAFRKGLITQTQLDDALAFQKQLFKALYEVKRLEKILVDDGFLAPEDAQDIWSEYQAALEKRKGVARPASLPRAAKSLGIDIGMVGATQEPTEATGDSHSSKEADEEDLFAPIGGEQQEQSGGAVEGKDDSVFELGTTARTQAATTTSPQPEPGNELQGRGTRVEKEPEDPAEMLREFLPQQEEERNAPAPQTAARQDSGSDNNDMSSNNDGSFCAEAEDRELSDSIEELDLSDDFVPRDDVADSGDIRGMDDEKEH